ncbi:MAG TPA: hypothetical protein VGL86_10140 [Polyangia bacterium]|jgi:hypothetical protein
MVDLEMHDDSGKMLSAADEDEDLFDPIDFDPELTTDTTFVDDDADGDTLAFRDAMRDIWRSEGRFELVLP